MATLRVQVDAAQLPTEGIRTTLHVQVGMPIPQTLHIPVTINAERENQ